MSDASRPPVSKTRAAFGGAIANALALAPCYFELPATASGDDLVWIQAMPAGRFRGRDGRPDDAPAWYIDAAIAARVLADLRANATPLVVDYEHQTLKTAENGQPAPAAGFIRDGEWREGSGLWLKVELTQRARQYLIDGEYRYFSPVFFYERQTGAVRQMVMGAITNNPAVDGMAQMELLAAARFVINTEEKSMNELLIALCTALGIKHDGRAEADVQKDVLAALTALKSQSDSVAALRTALGQPENASTEQLVAACSELKTKAAAKSNEGNPDPAKFVGVDVVNKLREDIAALTNSQQTREIEDLIKPALDDGRLLPAQEAWARDLGKSNLASLRSYLDKAQPIAALSRSQTKGEPPAGDKDANGLSADELAMCTRMNLDPKEFAATKTSD